MAWSLWSACDDSGLQMRSRVCGAQGSTPCVGNGTQRRDCNEIPGESVSCWTHMLDFWSRFPFSGMSFCHDEALITLKYNAHALVWLG